MKKVLKKRKKELTYSSIGSDKKGVLLASRRPRSASFAITIGPSWNRVHLLAPDLPLQHLDNGRVDGERRSNAHLLRHPLPLHLEPLQLRHGRFRDIRNQWGSCIQSVRDVFKLQLARAQAHDLRLALLGDEDLPAADYRFFRRRAVAGLPFCFHKEIYGLVHEAEKDIEEVEEGEDDEAHYLIHNSSS